MTDQRQALDRLIEAVETEEDGGAKWLDIALGRTNGDLGLKAYRGSLEAAKALHEALLPRWEWAVWSCGDAWVYIPTRNAPPIKEARAAVHGNPGRALFLAELRAFRGMLA